VTLNPQTWRLAQPAVYRMLEARWSQEFLRTGEIRIPSFAALRTHPDERRIDRLEGYLQLEHEQTRSDGRVEYLHVTADYSPNGYVLSTTMSDSGAIAREFGADSYIAIQNSTGFARAIAQQIPGFVHGSEGPCIYLEGRTLRRDFGELPLEVLQHAGQRVRTLLTPAIAMELADAPFFLKAPAFAWQLEYRFVWVTDHPTDGYLALKVPDARRFCGRRTTHAGFPGP
jgi:hypothetical protein